MSLSIRYTLMILTNKNSLLLHFNWSPLKTVIVLLLFYGIYKASSSVRISKQSFLPLKITFLFFMYIVFVLMIRRFIVMKSVINANFERILQLERMLLYLLVSCRWSRRLEFDLDSKYNTITYVSMKGAKIVYFSLEVDF